MKRIYLLVCIVLFGVVYIDAGTVIWDEACSDTEQSEKKTTFDEKKISKKSVFWDADDKFEDIGSDFLASDDDRLYAPPPGDSGNPQKILSFGNSDVAVFLLLSFFSVGYFFRQKR